MLNARSISRLAKIDWDFAGSLSESPFSAIHWHPSRFASQLPASLIGVLSSPGDLILDPFVGSGTTLVESQRLGRRSMGIDLNPVSCLISRAKTLQNKADTIRDAVGAIGNDATALIGRQRQLRQSNSPGVEIPATVQRHKWYMPRTLADLGQLWALRRSYRGIKRILCEAAFSAILMTVCRETRHWGYVCDNSTPKGNHQGEVLKEFLDTLSRLSEAYTERDAEVVARVGNLEQIAEASVICGSTLEILRGMPSESVDLILTSPPYFGVCDYVKAQRLSMEWFESEIEPLRPKEIGARSRRHKTEARELYLKELTEVFAEARRIVREKRKVATIVGESKTRAPILEDFRNCLKSVGFTLELDVNRRVSSQRMQAPSIWSEHVFVLSV